jgi:hypothetical protein
MIMRKFAVALPLMLVALTLAAWAMPVQVTVNGRPILFDQPPIMAGGRVLVPMRGVFEQIGTAVSYDYATRTITANSRAKHIVLQVGNTMATINGQTVVLDQAPIVVAGRAMVPLRFLSEALGAQVAWSPATETVTIMTPQVAVVRPQPEPVTVLPAGPLVTSVTIDTPGPVAIGQTVHLTLYGQPHARAWFDIGGHPRIAMFEQRPGVYVGHYRVEPIDNNPNALVTAHLEMPDGRTAALNASTTVALGSGSPITSVVHTGHRLHAGQTMTVTLTGVPGGHAWFDVGHRTRQLMTEVSPGVYVGSYTAGFLDYNPNAMVIGHLVLRDGRTAALQAPDGVAIVGY